MAFVTLNHLQSEKVSKGVIFQKRKYGFFCFGFLVSFLRFFCFTFSHLDDFVLYLFFHSSFSLSLSPPLSFHSFSFDTKVGKRQSKLQNTPIGNQQGLICLVSSSNSRDIICWLLRAAGLVYDYIKCGNYDGCRLQV